MNENNEWKQVLLSDVAFIIMGQSPKGTSYNEEGNGVPLINGPTEFTDKYPVIKQYTTEPTKYCEEGDILLCVRGSSTGRMNIAKIKCCIGRGIGAIRQREGLSDTNYIWYVLEYNVNEILTKTAGSTFPNLASDEINKTEIYLPPLDAQIKIARIIGTVDRKIFEIEKKIKQFTQLKKALAKKLLMEGIGHTEFKESEIGIIPVEWTVKCLRDITTIIMGQSPNSNSYNEEGEGLPFYQGKTEFGYMYPEAKKWCTEPTKVAEAFDVLISVRAPVGTVNICEEKSCIGRGLGAVRETTNSYYKFIYYLLDNSQAKLNEVGQGSTFTAINSNDLASLKIAVPQIEEQHKIADILSALDNQILLYTDQKSDYTQLKEGLIQQLLTGKIRVKVED